MKKYLVGLLLGMALALPWNWAYAYSWGKLYDETVGQTRLTILGSANPGYFYDFYPGNNRSSNAGFVDHVFTTHDFLYFDLGWQTPLDSREKGIGIGGASLDFGKMFNAAFPESSSLMRSLVPATALPFWQALFFGVHAGWDFDNAQPHVGLHSGLSFKF